MEEFDAIYINEAFKEIEKAYTEHNQYPITSYLSVDGCSIPSALSGNSYEGAIEVLKWCVKEEVNSGNNPNGTRIGTYVKNATCFIFLPLMSGSVGMSFFLPNPKKTLTICDYTLVDTKDAKRDKIVILTMDTVSIEYFINGKVICLKLGGQIKSFETLVGTGKIPVSVPGSASSSSTSA